MRELKLTDIHGLTFTPDGERLAIGERHSLTFRDIATGTLTSFLPGIGNAELIQCSPDGERVTVVSWDQATGLHDAFEELPLHLVHGIGSPGAFSPDGSRYATLTHLWSVADDKQIVPLEAITSIIAWSPDSSLLATVGARDTITVWDSRNGERRVACRVASGPIDAVEFSPDSKCLATRDSMETILWDVASGAKLAAWTRGTLRFGPHGDRLVIHRNAGGELWEAQKARKVAELECPPITAVAFSPDGSRVVTAHGDEFNFVAGRVKELRFWDTSDGVFLASLSLDGSKPVKALAFSPDGMRLYAAEDEANETTVLGVTRAEIELARMKTLAIERQMNSRVSSWIERGPATARAILEATRSEMTSEEFRVARNMVLRTLLQPQP